MDRQNWLDTTAEKYRGDGFDVIVEPGIADLPSFLADDPVDILARKGGRIITFKAVEEAAPDDEPFELAAEFGSDSALSLIEEVEMLLNPLTLRSALVMAWSAFEAAARVTLQPGATAFAGFSPKTLIDRLLGRALISDEEYHTLLKSLSFRNIAAHGGRPDDLPPDLAPSVLSISRRLLERAGVHSKVHLRDTVSVAIVREGRNPTEFGNLVEGANHVLFNLLGRWREGVSVKWDLAEDARNRPVLVLKLSDVTGTVSATFEPSELEVPKLLESRMNRLWGDLLEIRSHSQVKRLLRWPEMRLGAHPVA